jgi:hypothetical protein
MRKSFVIVQLCLLLQMSFCADAMQESRDKICHLWYMPDGILDIIAYFITDDWESDEAFIERTRVPKKIPFKIYELLVKYWHITAEDAFRMWHRDNFDELNGWSSDGSMVNMFSSWNAEWFNTPEVMVIAVKREKEKNEMIESRIVRRKILEKFTKYHNIAVANGGKMMAVYSKKKTMNSLDDVRPNDMSIFYEYTAVLELQKMKGDVKKILPVLPHNFIPTHMAFNQQTTKLIVHGRVTDQQDNQHIIFPLKKMDDPIYQEGPMTLQRYFNHKGVCKQVLQLSGR